MTPQYAGQAQFAVYPNAGTAYVMAYLCATCGGLGIAFSDDAYGLLTGGCSGGHQSTVTAS